MKEKLRSDLIKDYGSVILLMYDKGKKISDIMAFSGASIYIINKVLKSNGVTKRTKSDVMKMVNKRNKQKYGTYTPYASKGILLPVS